MYFKSTKESRPLFAERFRKIHLVTVPTASFQALTMTLHIKLFTLFLSGQPFFSLLDMEEQLLGCRFISLACSHSPR